MDDLLAALTETCGTCDGDNQVAYCHAWGVYLCVSCRASRNDEALRVTPEKIAERAGYPSQAAMDAAFLATAAETGRSHP